jgi:O-antigen ligase
MLNKAIYLTLILFLIALLSNKRTKNFKKNDFILFLVFTGYFFLSSFVFFHNFSTNEAIAKVIGNGFGFVVLFIMFLTATKVLSVKELIRPFYFSCLLITFCALIIYLGWEPTFYSAEQNEKISEISKASKFSLLFFSGPYANKNGFAQFLVVSLTVLSLNLLVNLEAKYFEKLVCRFLIVTCLIFLLATVSRGGILAVAIIFGLYALKQLSLKKSILALAVTVPILLLIYFSIHDIIYFIFERFDSEGIGSRQRIWKDAIDTVLENPFSGVGTYTYNNNGRHLSAHNSYLQMVASNGIFVFTFWFIIHLTAIYSAFKVMIKHAKSKVDQFSLLSSSSVLAIITTQFFESQLIDPFGTTTVFFMIMFMLNRYKILHSNNR